MNGKQPIVKLGKHVLLTREEMEAAPADYPPELKALGKELVTNGAGLWASQNRYGNCPPTTWYPDPRIAVAITLSLFRDPGVCLGRVQTEPPPDRDWAHHIAEAKVSPYYVGDEPFFATFQAGLFDGK